MTQIKCFSCGGFFPDIEGPVHRYMDSSPGCWSDFGELMAMHYSDPRYREVHRIAVDAYAAQHPGSAQSRQAIQSVGVHLVRLYLFLEHGLGEEKANDAICLAAKSKNQFFALKPPSSFGLITVADILKESELDDHKQAVRQWASSVWKAWANHHDTIRDWADNCLKRPLAGQRQD